MFVQKYFPKSNTLPDANTKKVLTSIMHAAMTVAPSLADADNNYKNAVATVCNSNKQIFPQRAMFNLMARWAHKRPQHFQRDAMNVLVVLSHQMNYTLIKFLYNARTWHFSPPTKKKVSRQQRKYSHIS
jgi:hypothetical protein